MYQRSESFHLAGATSKAVRHFIYQPFLWVYEDYKTKRGVCQGGFQFFYFHISSGNFKGEQQRRSAPRPPLSGAFSAVCRPLPPAGLLHCSRQIDTGPLPPAAPERLCRLRLFSASAGGGAEAVMPGKA